MHEKLESNILKVKFSAEYLNFHRTIKKDSMCKKEFSHLNFYFSKNRIRRFVNFMCIFANQVLERVINKKIFYVRKNKLKIKFFRQRLCSLKINLFY